jgi:hypothetical protein
MRKRRIVAVALVLVLVGLLLSSQVVIAQDPDPDEVGCCNIGYGASKCVETTRDICTNVYNASFSAGGHCQNNQCTPDPPSPRQECNECDFWTCTADCTRKELFAVLRCAWKCAGCMSHGECASCALCLGVETFEISACYITCYDDPCSYGQPCCPEGESPCCPDDACESWDCCTPGQCQNGECIPEPATILLTAAGLGAAGFWLRRRKGKSHVAAQEEC